MELDFDAIAGIVEKSSKLPKEELERRLTLYSERAAAGLDIFTGESHGIAGLHTEG